MECCDRCGDAVKAEWVAYHKTVVEYKLTMCNHHKQAYASAMCENWELLQNEEITPL